MSKMYQFSIIVAIMLFLVSAPAALAHTSQGDTGFGPKFLAQGDEGSGNQGGDNQGDDGEDSDDGNNGDNSDNTGATGTDQQGQQGQMGQQGQTGQQQGQVGQQQGQTGQDNTLLPQTGEVAPSGSTSMLWVASAVLALLALAGLSSFAGKKLI
jgi:hypothetical protein